MNSEVLNEIIFKEKFNEAVIFLEMHEINFTLDGISLEHHKKSFNKETMQHIIDIFESIKFYYDEPVEKEKVVSTRKRNIKYNLQRQVD